ncbi:MAG TPA: helix-turn-helix domain-containing protein, partial [Kofleriaceae bacterium]|nr:helix-turn-helix domain-containing protein [Kofleriaceae bacterium]
PALRERREDIVDIASQCMTRAAEKLGRNVTGMDASALTALCAYHWPGNVRELAHVIERAVLLARRSTLGEADIPLPSARQTFARSEVRVPETVRAEGSGVFERVELADSSLDLRSALENLERKMIERALEKAGGNRTEAAALLGLNRTTLVEKLRKYAA